VEGGREANGAQLYIARVEYNGGVHTAKCGEHLPGAHLAFSGTEVVVNVREPTVRPRVSAFQFSPFTDAHATGLRSVVRITQLENERNFRREIRSLPLILFCPTLFV
jgi:hypothetical protein